MQHYFCKCCKTVEKSTDAMTTGNRLQDFRRGHECWGCPFVVQVKEGWPPKVIAHECRMSKSIRYGSYTDIRPGIKSFCVGHIYTLDFDFAQEIARYFNTLEGRDGGIRKEFSMELLRASEFVDDGLYRITALFQKNKKGMAAKETFFKRFFDEGGYRADLPNSEEKKLVLAQIRQGIEAAKDMDELPVEPTAEMQGGPMEKASAAPTEEALAEPESYVPIDESPDMEALHSEAALEQMESVYASSTPLFVGMPVHAPLVSTHPLIVEYIGRTKHGSLERIITRDTVSGSTQSHCKANLCQGGLLLSPAEVQAAQEQLASTRGIPEITAEIRLCKQQTVQSIVRIGQCLQEAKSLLQHGQWLEWLEQDAKFTERTAQRFMQLAEQFPNPSPVTDLNYTKLLALLAIPEDERELFLTEKHTINGEEKAVAEMSKRELQQAIKERNAANERAARAEERISEACAVVAKEKRKTEEAQSRVVGLEARLKEAEARPIDVAVQEPTPEQLDTIRAEAQQKAAAEYEKKRRAEEEAHRAAESELRRQLAAVQGAAEPLPRWLTEQAAGAFTFGIDGAVEQYITVANCMVPEFAVTQTEICLIYLKNSLDRLYKLLDKAKAATEAGEQELPDLD